MVKIGDTLPSFSLKDQHNQLINSDEWIGQATVLYFYPANFTPFCTQQACFFRDQFAQFKKMGARIVGISQDEVASHQKFANKYQLPFSLLSDYDNKVRALFGVERGLLGLLKGRATYVFNAQGILVYYYSANFRITAHIQKAIQQLMLLAEQAN